MAKTDYIIEAANELGNSFKDAAGLATNISQAMYELNNLYDHGYSGAGDSMISFGVTLVMFPEPFMISDVVGSGVIAAGLLYNRFVPHALYIDDIFETIQEQVKAVHLTNEDRNSNFSIPVDLSSMRFEL
jgi:hypothetical protein